MAPTSKFLLFSAIVVVMSCYTHGQTFSKHDKDLLDSLKQGIKDGVSKNCGTIVVNQVTVTLAKGTDADVDALCTEIPKKKNLIMTVCSDKEYKTILKVTCDKIAKSTAARNKVIAAYDVMYKKLSASCQTKAGAKSQFKTWYDIESDCAGIKKNSKAYEKACPKNDYSNLKKAVCGGASAVVSGLATLGLCLVAALFTKQ